MRNLIKKIISENDLDWIKDVNPSLKNKIIFFEPMLDLNEWEKVNRFLLSHVVTYDEDILWWSGRDLDSWDPIGEDEYLHHLIISKDGRMVFGGMDNYEADFLLGDGYSESDIRNSYEGYWENVDYFMEEHSHDFDTTETIDGRRWFNLPYKEKITESDDFFNSIKDDESKPKIIPGGIIDTRNSSFSKIKILKEINRLGYRWYGDDEPIFKTDGSLFIKPHRYIFLGPIPDPVDIHHGVILHDDDLDWIKEMNLIDLVYTT